MTLKDTDCFGKKFIYHDHAMPCKVFSGADIKDWLKKLNEETGEVTEAAIDFEVTQDSALQKNEKWHQLGLELVDVITVCHSMLESYGFGEEDIKQLFLEVNKKNGQRGYFRLPTEVTDDEEYEEDEECCCLGLD